MSKVFCVLLALAMLSCGGKNEAVNATDPPASQAAPLDEYKIEVVAEHDTPVNVITAPGKVEANSNRVARVMLPVPGRVTQVMVKFGDTVQAQQLLAVLESPEADAAISAELQAEAALNQAKSSFAKADADLERLRDLYQNDAIARKQLLEAEFQKAQAQAGVSHAEAQLLQAKRRLETLGLDRAKFGQPVMIRSPLAGKVLEVGVVAGEYRNDPNQPLMTVADLSMVWVTADVPESAIRFVQRGERVEIELTAFPGERFPGRVTQIADVVDAATRTVKVRAELANSGGRLRPEMFGQIRHIDAVRRLPWVPISSVVQIQGRSVVYLERNPRQFEAVEVSLEEPVGDFQPVTAGVKAGDRVVADGALLLRRN